MNDSTKIDTEYWNQFAKSGYEAYGNFRNFKTHDGKDMPQWADLTEVIQEAWRVSAKAIVEESLRRQ